MPRHALLLLGLGCVGACRESSASSATATAVASAPVPSAAAAPSADAPRPTAGCPDGMAKVDDFCIDKYEAQLAVGDGAASSHSPYERPKSGTRYVAVSRPGVAPQAYVSRLEAKAACEAAGKHLCRARQWYRACAGTERRRYPYGSDAKPPRCNVGKGHALHAVFGKVTHTYDAHYNNPRVNQEPGFLAKTAEYSGCVSDEGVFDLVGNLHEWVADDVSASLKHELPFEKGDHWLGKRGMGVFMGGYFSSHGEHGRGCQYVTATHAPDYHDYSVGFRCCTTPASMAPEP